MQSSIMHHNEGITMTITTQSSGLTATVHVESNPGEGQEYSETELPAINWGDGIDETVSPSGTYFHKYSKAGTYTVKFTVVNDCGKTHTANVSVTVEEPVTSCSEKTKSECDLDPTCHWWTSDSKCHSIPEPTDYPTLSIVSDIDILGGVDIYIDEVKQSSQTPTTIKYTESDIGKTVEITGVFGGILSSKKKPITLVAGENNFTIEMLMDNKEILAGGALGGILLLKYL